MSDRKTLAPAPGCIVRDPATYLELPPEGLAVEMDSYWIRRLNAGDVLEVPPASAAPAKSAGDK